MVRKKTKNKKPKIKTWEIVGYYIDGKGAYTMLEDKKDRRKHKMIKGVA